METTPLTGAAGSNAKEAPLAAMTAATTTAAGAAPPSSKRQELLRAQSSKINPVNPFIDPSGNKLSIAEKVRIFFMCLLFIPVIRFLLVLFLTILCMSWCLLVGCISPNQGKLRGILMQPVRYLPRIALYVLGFWYISFERQRSPTTTSTRRNGTGGADLRKGRIIVSNHTTMLDVFVLIYSDLPSFLSKSSVLTAPLIGTVAKALHVIGVDRFSAEDREKAKKDMMAHIQNPDLPPLLIFPEGTTTRSDCMMRFKPGAFMFEQSVQPMLVIYNPKTCGGCSGFDPSNTATTSPLLWLLRVLCQVSQTAKVVYLPVYEPSEQEKVDHLLYADRVRNVMVAELTRQSNSVIHSCEQTSDDFLIWKQLLAKGVTIDPIHSYSLHDVRSIVALSAPARLGGHSINVETIRHAAERYIRMFYFQRKINELVFSQADLVSVHEHVNILSSTTKASKRELTKWKDIEENHGFISSDAFATALVLDQASANEVFKVFMNASSKVTNLPNVLDVGQMITALTLLSPLQVLWEDRDETNVYEHEMIVTWLEYRFIIAHALAGGSANAPITLTLLRMRLCPDNGEKIASWEDVCSEWKRLGFKESDYVSQSEFIQANVDFGIASLSGSTPAVKAPAHRNHPNDDEDDGEEDPVVDNDSTPMKRPVKITPPWKGYILVDYLMKYLEQQFASTQKEVISSSESIVSFFLTDAVVGHRKKAHHHHHHHHEADQLPTSTSGGGGVTLQEEGSDVENQKSAAPRQS